MHKILFSCNLKFLGAWTMDTDGSDKFQIDCRRMLNLISEFEAHYYTLSYIGDIVTVDYPTRCKYPHSQHKKKTLRVSSDTKLSFKIKRLAVHKYNVILSLSLKA